MTAVPSFKPLKTISETGTPFGFKIWPTSPNAFKEDMLYCIVMKFKSDYLQERFKHIISLGATYDHEKYRPHISLSYDVDKNFDLDKLPSLKEIGDLQIIGEFSESMFSE